MEGTLVFITGGSKGLGAALVHQYLDLGYVVFSISRSLPDFEQDNLHVIVLDLSKPEALAVLENKCEDLFQIYKPKKVLWINNAGTLGSIAPIHKVSYSTNNDLMQLNLMVPMQSAHFLITLSSTIDFHLEIISISSGAGLKPYAGWTGYCVSKAGLEMLTKTIAAEQIHNHTFKIGSFNPGVMDTGMQDQIRSTSIEDFEQLNRFILLKTENKLASPKQIAQGLYEIQSTGNYSTGSTVKLQ